MTHIYNVVRTSAAPSIWQTYVNSGKTLPARVNNRALYGPILNQESLGACSAFASTQWRMALYVLGGGTYERLSELAQYYEERVLNNTVSSDSGATMQEAVQVLETYGAMPEADDPYDPNYATTYTQAPPNDWDASLKLLPTQAFYIGNNLADVKDALAQGMPIMFGMDVFAELESGLCAQTGWLEMPADPSNSLGGHMINIIGYDDDLQALLCPNQWGSDWGIHNDASLAGCFWMPYTYFESYGFDAVAGIPDNGKSLQPQPLPTPFVKPVTDTYTISVSVSDTSITLGQSVTVNGQTLCNGQPYPNASVAYEFDDANGALVSATVTSDASGKYSVAYTPKTADTIQGVVSFLDPYGDMPSASTDTITVSAPQPTPTPSPQPVTAYLNGGDVSKFQGTVNWPDAAKSWTFSMIKVLDGKTPIDPDFAANYTNAKQAGVLRGGYQVGYPIYDTAADSYAAYKAAIGNFELPPTLDLEAAGCGSLTPTQVTAWAVQWLTIAVQVHGSAILYSNEDFFNTHIDVTQLPKGTLLWVANYSKEPALNWTFWQHTNAATVTGISGNVDTDYFNGTKEELIALTTANTTTVQATPMKAQVNGVEVDAYEINGKTYVIWAAIPGVKDTKTSTGEWNFVTTSVDEKPVSVTLTYGDGSTQTTKF